MKNYQINPEAKKLNLTIQLPIQLLETEGWDFDEYHHNTAEALNISFEEAQQSNYEEYSAELKIYGKIDNPYVSVSWFSHDRNENTDSEDSGDDKQAIKDVVSLLNQGLIQIDDREDYSLDDNDNYVESFVSK